MRGARTAALGMIIGVALAAATAGSLAAAPNATLAFDPPNVSVAAGQAFTVHVVQDAPIATSGAQATITFDPKLLQVISVTRGAAYAAAPVFLPSDMAATIRAANTSGRLAQVAAAFTPPTSVAPGRAVFLEIQFRALACGQTDLMLPVGGTSAQMISGQTTGYGNEVSVGTVNGHVMTCVGPDAVTTIPIDPAPGGSAPSGSKPLVDPMVAGGLIAAVLVAGVLWGIRRQSAERRRVERSMRRG